MRTLHRDAAETIIDKLVPELRTMSAADRLAWSGCEDGLTAQIAEGEKHTLLVDAGRVDVYRHTNDDGIGYDVELAYTGWTSFFAAFNEMNANS